MNVNGLNHLFAFPARLLKQDKHGFRQARLSIYQSDTKETGPQAIDNKS